MLNDQRDGSGRHPGDLGRRLAARRAELGLTVAALARQCGMDPGYVRYLEDHPAVPTPETVLRLADALDTTPGHLLGDVEPDAPPVPMTDDHHRYGPSAARGS